MSTARDLTPEEVKLVLEHGFEGLFSLRNQLLFALGIVTGFRIGELLSLTYDDVLNPDGSIKQMVYIDKRKMKGRLQSRDWPLVGIAREYLAMYIQQYPGEGNKPLFKSRKGNRAISVVQAWRVLMKAFRKMSVWETGGTHTLRKTFAMDVWENIAEKDIVATMNSLGHRNMDSTVYYLRVNQKKLHDKVKQRAMST